MPEIVANTDSILAPSECPNFSWPTDECQLASSRPSMKEFHSWPQEETTSVGPIESTLISALSEIGEVDAIYTHEDSDGVLMVFVVAREHTDTVYEAILAAESELKESVRNKIEMRVRAHQGRRHDKAVPMGTKPIFVR